MPPKASQQRSAPAAARRGRQAGAQQQGQQLGIASAAGPAGEQLLARPGIGGKVLEHRAAGTGCEAAQGFVKSAPVYRDFHGLPPRTASSPGSFLTLHYRLAGPTAPTSSTPSATSRPRSRSAPASCRAGDGSSACSAWRRAAAATFELPPGEAFGERNPEMLQRVTRGAARRAWATPTRTTRSATWCSFPTPDGQASYRRRRCARSRRRRGCCSTSTIPLAGQPVTFEVQLIGVL